MTRKQRLILLLATFLFVTFGGIYGCYRFMYWAIEGTAEEQHATFEAWKKLHPEVTLTFEEWKRLKYSRLLPEQSTIRSHQ